jgi:hypothetical protein
LAIATQPWKQLAVKMEKHPSTLLQVWSFLRRSGPEIAAQGLFGALRLPVTRPSPFPAFRGLSHPLFSATFAV